MTKKPLHVWPVLPKTYTIETVMAELNIPAGLKAMILSPRRQADLVDLRAHIARHLRAEGLSYPAIGRVLNRDHTTILHMLTERKAWKNAA